MTSTEPQLMHLHQVITYLRKNPVTAITCMSNRVGATSFMSFLEFRHFPPGTVRNAEFVLVMVRFVGLIWPTAIIPDSMLAHADAIAAELGLRRADGVPRCISGGGGRVESFPLDLPNVFTIEYVPGHFSFKNDGDIQAGREADQNAATRFQDEYMVQRNSWRCRSCGVLWTSGHRWRDINLCENC